MLDNLVPKDLMGKNRRRRLGGAWRRGFAGLDDHPGGDGGPERRRPARSYQGQRDADLLAREFRHGAVRLGRRRPFLTTCEARPR